MLTKANPRFASKVWQKYAERLMYIISPAVAIALWQLLAESGVIDRRFYGAPSEVAARAAALIGTGELLSDLKISAFRIFAGFLVGIVPGVLLGLFIGLSRWVRFALMPLVAATFPIPKLALLPLLLVAFGIGEASKIALVAIGVFFIALYNTIGGVVNLPTYYQEVAKSFGISRPQYFRLVALPGALPHIFTGLKLSLGMAILLIVAAEFVGADSGIGYLVWSSWQILAVDSMYVGLIVLSLLGFVSSIAMEWIERKVLPWR